MILRRRIFVFAATTGLFHNSKKENSTTLRYIFCMPNPQRSFLGRHPLTSYFVLAFGISWAGAFGVAAPYLLRHQPIPQSTGILMFPAMLLGPPLSGVLLTGLLDGASGLTDLSRRLLRWRFKAKWYVALLIPPALILAALFSLQMFVAPEFAPNLFLVGILFGVPAGLLEEVGWTGFALHKMRLGGNAILPSAALGLVWSGWHLPVVNYLGTATPHGDYWLAYFVAFAVAMTAMRVLISWLYINTGSVFIAQLMHISSTGSLVVFSAPHANARQEVLWYLLYGALLWAVVITFRVFYGKRLTVKSAEAGNAPAAAR